MKNRLVEVKKHLLDVYISRNPKTIGELFEIVRDLGVTEKEFLEAVGSLIDEKKISLEPTPPEIRSIKYVRDRSEMWVYIVLFLTAATLISIYLLPNSYPFTILRWIFGSIFVLYLPGFVFVEALFPQRELSSVERLALSIGLSLAISPLVALLLNYTPWGIRLDTISVGLSSFTLIVAALAAFRKYLTMRH